VPEEGFIIEQRDLGGWGLVEVVSARELPICSACQELTTLWVARLDYSAELKVTDPKEQQGDVEEEEAEGEERRDGVDCWRRRADCC